MSRLSAADYAKSRAGRNEAVNEQKVERRKLRNESALKRHLQTTDLAPGKSARFNRNFVRMLA
ncbi:hypothetical protein [Gimesia aquarii]|uniref:hypothetical protein n=1 Tax=Gimesia aquarii TaxID=2527964 RepID=UPI0011A73D64|nr:hypothetical protein [Gimesia aquarii]